MEKLVFLGTGGARFVVSRQMRASGGVWISKGSTQVILDPGPGSLVKSLEKGLNPAELSAIILSHRHLDHSSDVNIMIEAMTEGGFKKRGVVFAPEDALEEDPVILKYVRSYVERIEILKEGKEYTVGELEFSTPLKHIHGNAETYGFKFEFSPFTLSWIIDTRYFSGLAKVYKAPVMVFNMVRLPAGPLDHLSLPDVVKILKEAQPRVGILTHFGMTVLRANPWKVAEGIEKSTGVKILVAKDGWEIDMEDIFREHF